jgi:hypothetical protein
MMGMNCGYDDGDKTKSAKMQTLRNLIAKMEELILDDGGEQEMSQGDISDEIADAAEGAEDLAEAGAEMAEDTIAKEPPIEGDYDEEDEVRNFFKGRKPKPSGKAMMMSFSMKSPMNKGKASKGKIA